VTDNNDQVPACSSIAIDAENITDARNPYTMHGNVIIVA